MSSWRLTAAQKFDAARRYKAGERLISIASDLGVTTQAIVHLARRKGLPLRSPTVSRGLKARVLSSSKSP